MSCFFGQYFKFIFNHHLSPEAEESLTKNGGGKTTLTVDDDEISINSTDLRVDVGFLLVSS